ncbi:cytochrome P450 [Tsukamurella sp. 8F]|uniref:cytochrome P450 n=1 Tax=unclassified Tsukamurella TaxID=2633480 RepID=UPI0023B9998F|nr:MULTISPECIES: cytochrome P450 [unclassified Tsukamurella]MDF0528315.1 cytochrome P450 [Tsukamurella sp. 8J]MDF0586140.1 cytochrome P450 [Tsukamurella sp. 8F]
MTAALASRWAVMHGLPRAVLGRRARGGDPLARLALGVGGWSVRHEAQEALRLHGPVVTTDLGRVVVGHAACREILRDRRWSTVTPSDFGMPRPLQWLLDHTDPGLPNPVEPPSMLVTEPPMHTHYRQLVARSFTPRAIEGIRGRVQDVSDRLLDSLAARSRSERTPHAGAELIAEWATLLPADVIAELLRLPEGAVPDFVRWGEQAAPLLDAGLPWHTFRMAHSGLRSLDEFFARHFAQLRREEVDEHPFARLVGDRELTDRELATNATLLVGAGFETTVNLLGNAVVLLLNRPDDLAALRSDPSGWPNAIEEVLRLESPVQSTARLATEDIDVAGTRVPRGAIVTLLLAAGNRDPEVFDRPTDFDIRRANARDNLAFGTGIHACIGSALARMEAAIALPALFERFPDLALDGPPTPRPLVNLHGYERIPVRLR